MKSPPASLMTLVLGVVLGFLITRGVDDLGGNKEDSGAEHEEHAGIPRREGSGEKASKRKVASGGGGQSSRGLQAILDLTNSYHGTAPSVEFYKAIDALSEGEVQAMLSELEGSSHQDVRTHKVWNALYGRWAKSDPQGAWAAVKDIDKPWLRQQACAAIIGEVSLTSLADAQVMLSELDEGPERQAALQAFIANASVQDPGMALEWLNKDRSSRNSYQYHQLFSSWASEDPEAAIAGLDTLEGPQARQQAMSGLAAALASQDPERALQFALGVKNSAEQNGMMSQIARVLAASDPQRALKMLDELPSGPQRNGVLSGITGSWFQNAPKEAMLWIESLPSHDRATALEQGMWQIIQSDIEGAAKLLESMPSGQSLSHYYSNVASQWAQTDPDAALRWVEGLPAGQRKNQATSGIINKIAESDPRKAASMLEQMGIDQNSSHQVGTIAGSWAMEDGAAAMAWMEGLDLRENERSSAVSSAFSQWVQTDSEAAAKYALSFENEKDRKAAIDSLVRGWAGQDPQGARDWVESHLEGDSKNGALGSLIQNLAYQDIETAVTMYDEATAGLSAEDREKHFGNVTSNITSSWSRHDPSAASEWLMRLPEGDQRTQSVSQLVDNWGDYDIGGAAEFVITLAEGKERNIAVERLVGDLSRSDPEAAFQWAVSVGDESKRQQLVQQAANQWKAADPEAARSAVRNADISDEARARILKGLDR
ncbi:hypothetical protein [Haloferula sp.]|uniref:hypothetical protein n=1 Tax=Haloferula sp. TaxID=2497595 RepID=UPI003C75CD14